MAEYLASIFGTEKDKVNCTFFYKIGACRHGDSCSRLHNQPTFSQTVLLKNLYVTPESAAGTADDCHSCLLDTAEQKRFDDFYREVFVEVTDKYGEIDEMKVCANIGEHLVGNVYIMFRREEDAERAVLGLNNRWFGQRPIFAEFSPVTDFRDACCMQYEKSVCSRAGYCNFMHVKRVSADLEHQLRRYNRHKRGKESRRRSRSRDRRRDRDDNRHTSSAKRPRRD